jgi:tripartite-type tricarboxylate transporter receptor subunit TctC
MKAPLWLAAGFTLAVAGNFAAAQQPAASYPTKPVRLVIPFAPGASTDTLARIAADELAKRLNSPFVAENVTGAGGTIGAAQVAKATGDGYVLLAGSPGPITISPVAQKGLPYDIAELRAVTLIAEGPGALVVRKDSPYKTVAELIAAARAKPGSLSFGSAGVGA